MASQTPHVMLEPLSINLFLKGSSDIMIFRIVFFQNISILSISSLQKDELKHLMGLIFLNVNKFKSIGRENRIKKLFYFSPFFLPDQ